MQLYLLLQKLLWQAGDWICFVCGKNKTKVLSSGTISDKNLFSFIVQAVQAH